MKIETADRMCHRIILLRDGAELLCLNRAWP